MDRLAPTRRPSGAARGFQKWRHLAFLHWPFPPDAIQKLLPPRLTIDTFDGMAWVGLVPFTMRDVRPRFAPSVPGISNFHELNVRTYVHLDGENPGVWFFSLEAASSLAVRLARAFWHLPYHKAEMHLDISDLKVKYSSARRWPAPTPAHFRGHWTLGDALGNAQPDTLEHFLIERYLLYAAHGGALLRGQVHHISYPLRSMVLHEHSQDLLEAAGVPRPQGAPHVLASPGVDVEVFALARM
jgi:uncharacterized protein